MLKEKQGRDVYIFSQTEKQSEKAHMYFVNHLGKFGLVISLFLISLFIIDGESFNLKFILFSLIFVGFLTYLASRFHQKFAHKIIIDFGHHTFTFYIYRSSNVIIASIDEVKVKILPRHIVFLVNNKKIFYRNTEDSDLLHCLNKIS